MLFNSHSFVFVFLPVTLFVYFALGRLSRNWALRWIIVASLVFYAWWRPANVLIIVPAMLVNFGVAKAILYQNRHDNRAAAKIFLALGIVFNICVLGYFKYTNFLVSAATDVFGGSFTLKEIVLPLGISFITFQKIAFLVDVHGKRIESFRFQDFFSFVLFFPQLVAGPIVHYREMMPQFHDVPCKFRRDDVSVGLTLFFFGLFKKVVLADSIAPLVSSVFATADGGSSVSLLPAWLAALGFTFQIYFDFSGYSDMALGAARLFGIRLPVNFNSPLRSSSIIDFWMRWHVSLTRFLTAYLYNPLALFLTRRRLASGRAGYGGRNTSVGAFLQLLMLPTVVTMFISGIWHGAGYLFMIWGLMHGFYLTVNHAWRLFAQRLWPKSVRYQQVMRPIGWLLTFVAVAVSMVVFRSTSVDTASNIIFGMAGLNGIELPNSIYDKLATLGLSLTAMQISPGLPNYNNLRELVGWLLLIAPLGLLVPNTLQILDRFEPAIGVRPSEDSNFFATSIRWNPSLIWAVLLAIFAFAAVTNVGGYTEFLYWQF
ncbi:MAG: MBOAT family protein [Gammaproteobacteria bacterium]|nr:MBOAT family protein [Gammaproteobacteria bacterium]